MAKVAINGLGRIGRAALKILLDTEGVDLVAVNDLAPVDNLVNLLRYDTVYGRYHREVKVDGDDLAIGDQRIAVLSEKEPSDLPWKDLGVDLVFECTGVFTDEEHLRKHVDAGAKFVILSAPTKSADVPTVVHGVNTLDGDGSSGEGQIVSCASCTTNCITPVVEVAQRRLGLERATMTTVHAYTATQHLVDGPASDFRRGRAAAANIIPASTGAALATAKALPQVEGLFDGVALRVPVAVGSIADIVFVTSRPTSVDEVNEVFTEESHSERYQGILGVSHDPLVSADIIGDSRASIVNLDLTQVVDGTLVKILAWYDNEWGFTNQMIREGLSVLGLDESR